MQIDDYTVEVIKVKARFPWAIKATMYDEVRYRGYRYKRDAIANLSEWQGQPYRWFEGNFYHNFNTAETLGILEESSCK